MLKEKTESIEIDISTFDRKVLEDLIAESCDKDLSINKIISNRLQQYLEHIEKHTPSQNK